MKPEGWSAASAAEIAWSVLGGRTYAQEVALAHLARHDLINPALNAVVHLVRDDVIAQADALDQQIASGDRGGLALAGVPVVIKDNIDVCGQFTATGSRAHGFVAAPRDAPVVAALRRAGAIVFGRGNMDELAMGASTQTSAFGLTRNPVDPRRSPGGSSGGCAAAVAAHQVPLSVGTDTGGSIREPSSQCGVFGLAPSPHWVSTQGVVPFMPSLDRVGPVARSASDLALLLSVMAENPALATCDSVPNGLRVGVVTELCNDRNQRGVLGLLDDCVARMHASGCAIVPVSIPEASRALSTYMTLTTVACVPWLHPYVSTGRAGEEVVRRHAIGLELTRHPRHREAVVGRRRLRRQTRHALTRCDVLLSPTMPTTAPLLDGEISEQQFADPMAAPYTDCWTVLANLTGLPALSLPLGDTKTDALPAGMMLSGPPGSDRMLLSLAHMLTT